MSTLAEQLVEALQEFGDRLERGERIVTTTIQRCPCNVRRERTGDKRCEMCGGKGWLIDAHTMFGADD